MEGGGWRVEGGGWRVEIVGGRGGAAVSLWRARMRETVHSRGRCVKYDSIVDLAGKRSTKQHVH